MIKIAFISLGCPKNQVDSEYMLGLIFNEPGFQVTEKFAEADVIVINTCGFIEDAKKESIETIINAGSYKKEGKCKALVITGCLTQRYKDEILKDMPEVDAILGTGNFDEIVETINEVLRGKRVNRIASPTFSYKQELPRHLTTSHYAYVKIAEGCNNNCTYCSIPKIRGPVHSRKIEDIYQEIFKLVNQGIKEVILVAQDTTQYGVDLYGKTSLVPLLKRLVSIDELKWLRILYSYPEFISDELIELIKNEEKLCNYLDLPVQHSSNRIRKLMGRRGKGEDISNIINKLRKMIPDVVLRTSLIVGFPGESKEDFADLVEFVRETKFDRLGVFKYSREEDTPAYKLSGHLSDQIKDERYEEIMTIQQKISLEKNQQQIGKRLEVIVDEINGEYALARSQYDAPEIDNQVYLARGDLKEGDLVTCKIVKAYEYDSIGERCYEFTK